MLSSSCSDSFLSCRTERRLSSNGRFPKAVKNKKGLVRGLMLRSPQGQTDSHGAVKGLLGFIPTSCLLPSSLGTGATDTLRANHVLGARNSLFHLKPCETGIFIPILQ